MWFIAARQPLWELCVDCDKGKLQAFLEDFEPVVLVPWKIYQQGRLECSVKELVQGLHLRRDSSWSQVSTEQGHSAASVVMKKHRTLGHNMLQTAEASQVSEPFGTGQIRCHRPSHVCF